MEAFVRCLDNPSFLRILSLLGVEPELSDEDRMISMQGFEEWMEKSSHKPFLDINTTQTKEGCVEHVLRLASAASRPDPSPCVFIVTRLNDVRHDEILALELDILKSRVIRVNAVMGKTVAPCTTHRLRWLRMGVDVKAILVLPAADNADLYHPILEAASSVRVELGREGQASPQLQEMVRAGVRNATSLSLLCRGVDIVPANSAVDTLEMDCVPASASTLRSLRTLRLTLDSNVDSDVLAQLLRNNHSLTSLFLRCSTAGVDMSFLAHLPRSLESLSLFTILDVSDHLPPMPALRRLQLDVAHPAVFPTIVRQAPLLEALALPRGTIVGGPELAAFFRTGRAKSLHIQGFPPEGLEEAIIASPRATLEELHLNPRSSMALRRGGAIVRAAATRHGGSLRKLSIAARVEDVAGDVLLSFPRLNAFTASVLTECDLEWLRKVAMLPHVKRLKINTRSTEHSEALDRIVRDENRKRVQHRRDGRAWEVARASIAAPRPGEPTGMARIPWHFASIRRTVAEYVRGEQWPREIRTWLE